MFSDFVRSYLPLNNPLGFGGSDWVIFTFAALAILAALACRFLEAPLRRLAERTAWCVVAMAALPVILRLALLHAHPVPTPDTADDFSYLLLGDTIAHLRLANAVHPFHRFFEALFILQEPSYSSVFPLGQGIVLAIGQILFRMPWAGVVLSVAALCGVSFWMLRAWTTPLWAAVGALLAVCEFGPLSSWMNSYWGGAVAAAAGCLVFGALPRICANWRPRDAVLLGLGMGVHVLSRPFESVMLAISIGLYFRVRSREEWRRTARALGIAVLAALPALGLTLLQNRAVTGSWWRLPNVESRYQYGVPATFTFQPNPAPHRSLTREQDIDYRAQTIVHGEGTDTLRSYFERLLFRVRFYRFFFLTPLYLALPFYLLALGEFRFVWALVSVVIFALGSNFYPYFQPHYGAGFTCIFVLISVTSLERLGRWRTGGEIARLILFLSAAQFLFWYGVHLSGSARLLAALGPYETWDFINYGDAQGRLAIDAELREAPGKQLVFVRYGPRHLFDEWIHNAADIDAQRVVFAGDLGAVDNENLRRYYPDRTAWLLEPDARPPRLSPYPEPAAEAPPEPPAEPPGKRTPNRIDPKDIINIR